MSHGTGAIGMADEQVSVEVRTLIDEMVAHYGAGDADGVLATLAGEDTVVVGKGTDES